MEVEEAMEVMGVMVFQEKTLREIVVEAMEVLEETGEMEAMEEMVVMGVMQAVLTFQSKMKTQIF